MGSSGVSPANVLLVQADPLSLDAALQEGSYKAEGEDQLPRSSGHAAFGAVQNVLGFLGCKPSSYPAS